MDKSCENAVPVDAINAASGNTLLKVDDFISCSLREIEDSSVDHLIVVSVERDDLAH